MPEARSGRWRPERLVPFAAPVLGAFVFGLAVLVLRRELADYRLADIAAHLASIPRGRTLLAALLTVASYALLTGYDALAFRWIGNALGYPRIALASFLGFVFSHNVGVSFLGGSAVRYRMLSSWGVPAGDIARVLAFNVATFWLGFLSLGGVVLVLDPVTVPAVLHAPFSTSRPVGIALLLVLAIYVLGSALWRAPLRIGGFELPLPRLPTTVAQACLSAADWSLAALCFFVLLPEAQAPSFPVFLGAYLLAQVIGLASHVPGGLGVFEGALVWLLSPWLSGEVVLGSAIAYRVVYYLAPLLIGVTALGAWEAMERRHLLSRVHSVLARGIPEVVPRAFAVATLCAGLVLLLSGATPAGPGRVEAIDWLPLSLIELSHLLGSLIGVALLLLARALQQRIDAAWGASLALLGAGVLASLAKGFDWEEASVLAALFVALLPCRSFFYRRSSLLGQSFTPDWIVGIGLAVAGTAVVTVFAYRHIEYSSELWWQFALDGHAPRSLRAMLGASGVLASFALVRLLRPEAPQVELPKPAEIERARQIVAESPRSAAHLALLGDKHLLFHEGGGAFLMYGIEGRSWISMGDPVGPAEARRELAWRFVELADRHAGRASFYEVSPVDLPVYVDLGLSLRKLGEEARVPLEEFSLEGSRRAKLRHARSRMEREGCRFEILPAHLVAPLLDEAQTLSDAWLLHKNTREKRFSLGRFDREYLLRVPLAVMRRGDRMLAFATLWAGGAKEELSVDLMRHAPEAPNGTMDALFAELMLWGKQQGYRWFSLGMAPLSGFEHHRLAPLWNRLGALLFRYGEHFYNFQGLREFKEKFDPVWEPRYLASPGGLAAPIVLTRVASLVSGGMRGVLAK